MPELTKDTAYIRSHQEEFKAAVERARAAFERIDGVTSVGYGLKQKDRQFGNDIAIIVFVREKKASEELAPKQLIPPSFEDYTTDVRVVPAVMAGACDNAAKYDTIQGGIQVTNKGVVTINLPNVNEKIEPGTIACIVRKRNDLGRENVYILSNHHVLHAKGHGPGDYVYHPLPPKPHEMVPDRPSVSLGPIEPSVPIEATSGPSEQPGDITYTLPGGGANIQTFIDCAIAHLMIDSKCCGSTCTKDTLKYAESIIDLVQVTPADADVNAPENLANIITDVRNAVGDLDLIDKIVTKVGRTTGKTQGKVVSVAGQFRSMDPNDPTVVLFEGHNAIEIEFAGPGAVNCKGNVYFSERGDSGSLVLDDQNRAVGLLSQVPVTGAPPGATSYACHIVPVLDHLNICIPCASTGKSHGSTHAEDGSGLAPSPLSPDNTSALEGQLVFTSQIVNGALLNPEPLTDSEIDHMHELLAEFRATARGPVLHAAFAEVRREIGYLVRNCRPVKVAWHRHQGPAFLAHVLNHLAGHSPTVPHEVKGVTRRALLERMRVVLTAHGSHPLRAALAAYGDDLIETLTTADNARAALAALRQEEPV